MAGETIARRYASALADVVMSSGHTDVVRSELTQFSSLFTENADLSGVFSNPSISLESKSRVLDQLIERARPSTTTANFLKVLSQNGRLNELADINGRFALEIEERSGFISVEITSARELADDQRKDFAGNLERLTGKRVSIRYSVDVDLIGGVVTRIGSTVYDDSIRTKLLNLKEELVRG